MYGKLGRRRQQQQRLPSSAGSFLRFSSSYKTLIRFILVLAFIALVSPLFFHFSLRRFHQGKLKYTSTCMLCCLRNRVYVLSPFHLVMAKMVAAILASWRGVSGKRRNHFVWTMVPFYLLWCFWGETYSIVFEGVESSLPNSKAKMQLRRCGWLNNPPLVCAHGGDSTNAFPNTMSAYQFALSSQVDCVEIDVSRSSDGVLFALHDRDLQRISGNSSTKVGHLRSKEIQELVVSHLSSDSKIPTIEDALTLISGSVRQVILDAKVGPPSYEKGLAKDIVSAVEKMQCKNCLIWAKSDSLARDIIKLSSDVVVGYIVMMDPNTGGRSNLLRMKGARVVGVYHPLIDERLVKILHGREKKVYAWTVDDEESMRRMLYEGADGIVTSNPSLLQSIMQDKRTQCLEEGFFLTP